MGNWQAEKPGLGQAYVEKDEAADRKRKQNAERQARWRERQREKGNRVGAVVPEAVMEAVKTGKLVVAVPPEVALGIKQSQVIAPALSIEDKEALALGRRLVSLVGWRQRLVGWLL